MDLFVWIGSAQLARDVGILRSLVRRDTGPIEVDIASVRVDRGRCCSRSKSSGSAWLASEILCIRGLSGEGIITSVSRVGGLSNDLLLRVVVASVTHRGCSISLWGRASGWDRLHGRIGRLGTVSSIITVKVLATICTLSGKGRRRIVVLDHSWWTGVVGAWGLSGVIDQNSRLTLEGLGVKIVNITVPLTALIKIFGKERGCTTSTGIRTMHHMTRKPRTAMPARVPATAAMIKPVLVPPEAPGVEEPVGDWVGELNELPLETREVGSGNGEVDKG